MADWHEFVRQRLADIPLNVAEKEDVCAELASHLEESYEAGLSRGLSDDQAAQQARQQAGDWQELRNRVWNTRNGGPFMRQRLHQLWIPGFLTFILSTTSLAIIQRFAFRPVTVSWHGTVSTVFLCVPWLLSLSFLGAFGAYFSARAGAARPIVFLSSAFPVVALSAAFILMFPIDLIVEPIVGNHVDFKIVATALLKDGTSWLLVPGAALFAGGLLASILFSRHPPTPSSAVGSEMTHG